MLKSSYLCNRNRPSPPLSAAVLPPHSPFDFALLTTEPNCPCRRAAPPSAVQHTVYHAANLLYSTLLCIPHAVRHLLPMPYSVGTAAVRHRGSCRATHRAADRSPRPSSPHGRNLTPVVVLIFCRRAYADLSGGTTRPLAPRHGGAMSAFLRNFALRYRLRRCWVSPTPLRAQPTAKQ